MWYVATSATVANGSTVVAINNGDDISNIQEKSALVFEDGSPVEVVRAYLDGGGNKFIQLARPWASTSRSNSPLVVFPTDADFAAATAELRRVIDTLQVASTVEAQTGEDDEKIMTSKKVKESVEHRTYLKAESDERFVNKVKIVGTVSQSGGIPTGAIIESGSNANGRYIKWADGTLICTQTIAAGSRIELGSGTYSDPYRTGAFDWDYPAPFVGSVRLIGTCNSNSPSTVSRGACLTSQGASSSQALGLVATTTSGDSRDATILSFLTVIGRWY